MALPADWRREAAPEPVKRSQQDRTQYNEGQCYDFVMTGEEKIHDYLAQDPNNIVLLSPAPNVFSNAVCITHDQLAQWRESETNITLACTGPEGRFPVDPHNLFVRLELREFPVYAAIDVDQALDMPQQQLFQITETSLVLQPAASADAVLNSQYINANHCQAGTTKRIYRLESVEFV